MRLKIQTTPPLPLLKAWYSTTDLDLVTSSISDLKNHICANVQVLREAFEGKRPRLTLTLDDFELLDESNVSILRDGDLVCIGGSVEEVVEFGTKLGKRKRVEAEASYSKTSMKKTASPQPSATRSAPKLGDPAKRLLGAALGLSTASQKRHATKPKLSPPSSSDSETSSEESSSEDTDSDATSGTDSDDDDDSDSSSSSSSSSGSSGPPSIKRTVATKQPQPPNVQQVRHVPPGHGLPQTHNRNARRRRKRQADRLSNAPPLPPTGSSAVNTIPIAGPSRKLAITGCAPSVAEALNSAFVSNENEGTLEPGAFEPSATPEAFANSVDGSRVMMSSLRNKNKKKGFKNSLNRPIPQKIVFSDPATEASEMDVVEHILQTPSKPSLVPPSEKQRLGQLPPNVFVTSVDVEADRWKTNDEEEWVDNVEEGTETLELPYGDPEPDNSLPTAAPQFEWSIAEAKFPSGKLIASVDQLVAGMYVGCMELAINPKTFTPDHLLAVYRITSIAPDILAKPLIRPGAAEISFDKTVNQDEDDAGILEGDEVAFTWNDISQAQWKVVDMI